MRMRRSATAGAAMIQHYFLTAVLPSDTQAVYRYYTRAFSSRYYSIGSVSPTLRIAPRTTGGTDRLRLYRAPETTVRTGNPGGRTGTDG